MVKGFFYACSFVVPWERIDLNQHYLSQAALGWWMGYLACQAVNQTELTKAQHDDRAGRQHRNDRHWTRLPTLAGTGQVGWVKVAQTHGGASQTEPTVNNVKRHDADSSERPKPHQNNGLLDPPYNL